MMAHAEVAFGLFFGIGKNPNIESNEKINVSLRGGRNTEQGGLFWCNDMWRQATFCFPL